MLDQDGSTICMQIISGGNVDKEYRIYDEILSWKQRVYVPKGLGKRIMESEYGSKVAGHFGWDRTMELLSWSFYWPNMELDVKKQSKKYDNCQQTKAQGHVKHGQSQPLEMAYRQWALISTEIITDLPESEGATMKLVLVDRFAKMAHFISIRQKASPTVARAYFENVWNFHGFPEDMVSNRDCTFTGQFFTDLYDYLSINRSMSTAYHPQSYGQREEINQDIESYSRSYCNYGQDDWASMLAMAEYAYNYLKYFDNEISPFCANYWFQPRTTWPTDV
jgi:hypothetical protein